MWQGAGTSKTPPSPPAQPSPPAPAASEDDADKGGAGQGDAYKGGAGQGDGDKGGAGQGDGPNAAGGLCSSHRIPHVTCVFASHTCRISFNSFSFSHFMLRCASQAASRKMGHLP